MPRPVFLGRKVQFRFLSISLKPTADQFLGQLSMKFNTYYIVYRK